MVILKPCVLKNMKAKYNSGFNLYETIIVIVII